MQMMMNVAQAVLMVSAMAMAAPALAENMTAKQFADARLAAFGKGDIDALMAQYSDDATVFTTGGVLHGKAQIKPVLEAVIKEFSQPGSKFNLTQTAAEGSMVSFVWNADTPVNSYKLGVETYVIADGKAVFQTLLTDAKKK